MAHRAPILNCQQGLGNKSGIYLFNLNIGFLKIKKIYMQLLKAQFFWYSIFENRLFTLVVPGVPFFKSHFVNMLTCILSSLFSSTEIWCLKKVSIQSFY